MKKTIGMAFVAGAVLGASMVGFAETAATKPGSEPNGEQPIAVVRGTPINNQVFRTLVMESAGIKVFDVVLNEILVQQACQQAGIKIDVQGEITKFLQSQGAPSDLTEQQKNSLIGQLLPRLGMSADEFQLQMETRAGLRALSQGKVDVTDDEVKKQFDAQYGARSKVLLFQTQSLQQAGELRKRIEQGHEDPYLAGRELALPVQELTIPKTDTSLPADIRDTIKVLKPGQLSASIQRGPANVLIYLLEEIPADTSVKFDDVKAKLKDEVFNAKQGQWMANWLAHLRLTAPIEVNDPVLKPQWDAYVARMRQQLEAQQNAQGGAAATAPAAAAPAK